MLYIESLVVFVVAFLLTLVIGLWAVPATIIPFAVYKFFVFKRKEVPAEDENADGTR